MRAKLAVLTSSAIAAAMVMAGSALAQSAIPNEKLSGFWNVDASSRIGAVPRAEPTEAANEITRKLAEAAAKLPKDPKNMVGLNSRICGAFGEGVPFVAGTSEPWQLIVTKDEVMHTFERPGLMTRHYYTDGRSLDGIAKLPRSSNGYSIAKWVNGDLVVTTRGLPEGGAAGGARKGPNTTLTETYSLTPDGKRLKLGIKWEDPVLLKQPLSYFYMYDRAEPGTYALTQYCDPTDGAADIVDGSNTAGQ